MKKLPNANEISLVSLIVCVTHNNGEGRQNIMDNNLIQGYYLPYTLV